MTISLKDVGSGFKRNAINENFTTLQNEINNNLLSKNGGVGLEADLDANSQKIINLAQGVNNTDAVNVQQLNGAISAASSGLIASQTETQKGSAAVSRVFTFSGITYTVGGNNLYVFQNGVKLAKGRDYTETSSSSITVDASLTINPNDDWDFITNIATTTSVGNTSAIVHTQSGTDYNLATYLQNRQVINVKDFGAVGDGVTDDSAAFAAAKAAIPINLMATNQSAFIYAPRGNYYLATGADFSTANGSIGFIGDGQDATIIIAGVDQTGINCNAVAMDFTVVSKPTWDASIAAGTTTFVKDTSGRGLYSVSGGRPRFERVTSYGFGDVGIGATRMTNGAIIRCRVTACDIGIEVPSPSTPTTTSRIQDCYVSSTSTYGIYLNDFTHGVYDNNICEAGATGLYAVLCTGTTFSKMYFESNTVQHYKLVNCFPTILGRVAEVPGGAGTPPNASQNIYSSAISASDMSSTIVEPNQLASTHLGILGYDNGASATKGLTFSEIKPTGPSRRVRGLRLLSRDTDSGRLDAVGTIPVVNGAKAAHITTLQITSSGTVVTGDNLISSVTKVGTGEYELTLNTAMHPDFVNAKTYQVYSAGATPKLHAQIAYTSANKTTYDSGGNVSKIYVITSTIAGTQTDSGFTIEIGWNLPNDVTS